jgi:hypothetical protein
MLLIVISSCFVVLLVGVFLCCWWLFLHVVDCYFIVLLPTPSYHLLFSFLTLFRCCHIALVVLFCCHIN